MSGEVDGLTRADRNPHLKHLLGGRAAPGADPAAETDGEGACPAFGYLRGRERAVTLELRFRTGDVLALPYAWLGPARFDPSVGLLLRFAGDAVTLVLIRGSNLDALTPTRSVNLTDRGVFRHKVTWVRELDEDELRRVAAGEPTVDGILVGECESADAVKTWLARHAPRFLPA